MCGRYATTMSRVDIQLEFHLDVVAESYDPAPNWNVAPKQDIPIVLERRALPGDQWLHDALSPAAPAAAVAPGKAHTVRALTPAMWGLIPPWAKDASRPMINARMETLAEKPSFAPAAKTRRCIIPASGYFEWRKPDKTPFYIYRVGRPLAFAGLYGWWKNGEEWVLTATIITRAAAGEMATIHDRVPLILEPTEYDAWLDPTIEASAITASARPDLALSFHEVHRAVGNVRHNTPENIVSITYTPQV
ncbi:SOS response-associated peptidase [Trueperella pyogenes]|uniref:SOS response-associated peptidase n=1 Tax=Trueperella pyogenes TaxID=1661 RepID=UPI00046B08E1|nr:SOS response-associated peptidase [Trueperella pyogenes]